MKTLFSVLGLLLLSAVLKAQCSFTVTASSIESRCKESGTITITPSIPDAYTYQITSGPVTTNPTFSSVFNNLPAGNYIVSTSLLGCTVTTNVSVAGNYMEPGLLSATVRNIACPGGTGSITANQPANGRTPYSYSIISGPVIRPVQTSNLFADLPAGNYSIQAYDSCGVVRTSAYTVAVDTGNFVAYTYGWALQHANCTDLIVCPTTGFTNTQSHSLLKIWYIKPNGDTLKVNELESPVLCDTLIGESHSYGTWTMLSFDSCGRKRSSTFDFNAPSLGLMNAGPVCGGYNVVFGNQWKYGQTVHYIVRKCSDSSIVYNVTNTPPTTFYSQPFTLEYDTCYLFEHFNECGDTVRTTRSGSDIPFNINACQGPACSSVGKGDITVYQDYLSGVSPITYRIISGPEGVGNIAVQNSNASWVNYRNLALGNYSIEGTDACGEKDTVNITLNIPLQRTMEITQTPNCSGGGNIHVKLTSNFYNCQQHAPAGSVTYVTATSPGINPVNVASTATTATAPSVWEADYINITPGPFLLRTYAYEGCNWDTTITIASYTPPVINNAKGYLCNNTGLINFSFSGGKPAFQYRIKPSASGTWGSWQDSLIFSGLTVGNYDINVNDVCPNGSITSFSFVPWAKSTISINAPCAVIGQPFTLAANPLVNGIDYQWLFNGNVVATGASFTIPSFQETDNGIYTLQQVFPGGSCADSAKMVVGTCSYLPLSFDKLTGVQNNNGTILLKWKTFQEDNTTVKFYIERSENAVDFYQIGLVNSRNVTQGTDYIFTDDDILKKTSFYRIRYVQSNGRIDYSNTISFSIKQLIDQVMVSPVPFKTSLRINFSSKDEQQLTIKLFDFSGKQVYSETVDATQGNNNYWLNKGVSELPPGVYILELTSPGSQFSYKQKIVKSR